jgi:hypothetical protein
MKNNNSKKVKQEKKSPAPVRSGPAFMSGDLSSSEITVLREMMITVNKKRDEYYRPPIKTTYEEWSFFSMCYVALADQISDLEERIKEQKEYDLLSEKIKAYKEA